MDSFFCGWSSTTFLFVNRIVEQVVGTVGSDSCSYHVMLDCLITRLFAHLHMTLLGVGEILSILWAMKTWGTWQLVCGTEGIWLARLSDCGGFGGWRREAAGQPTTITICFRNGGFHPHKVSVQTIPSLWSFVSGATSMLVVDFSNVVMFSAISGHPQVGALRNLEQLRAARNDSMVHHVLQLQQRNRIGSGWCS